MADPNSPVDPTGVADTGSTQEKKPGLFSSPVVRIVVAIVVVLVILGVLAGVFFTFIGGSMVNDLLKNGQNTAVTQTTTGAAPSTPATGSAPIVNPEEQPLANTFTFRNVFAPTIKPTYETAATAETSGTSSSSSASEPDTLYLVSIQTTDGEKTATFTWNGQNYTLSEGETLDSTPWKVLSIGTDSVVMLYGDTQVTLTLGQGVSK